MDITYPETIFSRFIFACSEFSPSPTHSVTHPLSHSVTHSVSHSVSWAPGGRRAKREDLDIDIVEGLNPLDDDEVNDIVEGFIVYSA